MSSATPDPDRDERAHRSRTAGKPVDPLRLRRALWRARLWIFVALVAGAAVAVPVARRLAPLEYLARASFLWEAPIGTANPDGDARALRTMIDSVELPPNLAEVRRRLKLPKTLPEIGGSVEVVAEEGSNLVLVTARDGSPTRAARVANTLIEVFLESRRAYEAKRRRENVRVVGEDLQRARRELEVARARYDAFRREHGITDLAIDTQQAIDAAANLRAAAELAHADALAEEARTKALRSEAKRLPRATVRETVAEAAPVAVAERERLRQARLDLAEAQSRLGPDHPSLQALEARVEVLQAEVARASAAAAEAPRATTVVVTPNAQWEQIQGTVADAEAQRQVALQRSRGYEDLQAAARQRLRDLSAIEGEASELLAAKRVAEAHVLELADLQSRAVDAARSPGTGLRFVARARPPDGPESRTQQRIIMAAIPLLALLVVLAIVIGRTIGGLRVCAATELAYWGRGPVVGSTTWPREPESLYTLVEELDDMYPVSVGTTLVIGATPGEDEAARHVAEVMAETTVQRTAPDDDLPPGEEEPVAAPESRTALARVRGETGLAVAPSSGDGRITKGWDGEPAGPNLRRAARLADRVLVLVRAGALTPPEVAAIRTRLGREDGIGYVIIDQEPDDAELADRAGPVDEFWKVRRGKG